MGYYYKGAFLDYSCTTVPMDITVQRKDITRNGIAVEDVSYFICYPVEFHNVNSLIPKKVKQNPSKIIPYSISSKEYVNKKLSKSELKIRSRI